MIKVDNSPHYADDPYQNLAIAIVKQAADDFLEYSWEYKLYRTSTAKGKIEQLLKFFHSEWYGELTELPVSALMRELEQEASDTLDQDNPLIIWDKIWYSSCHKLF